MTKINNNYITIFFGEIGSDKQYLASRFSNHLNGDDFLPRSLKEDMAKFKKFSKYEMSSFVRIQLLDAILNKAKKSDSNIFVSQALYSDSDRIFLKESLELYKYKVGFVWVKPSFIKNFLNLLERKNSFKWILYWLRNKPLFEKPSHKHIVFEQASKQPTNNSSIEYDQI